MSIELNLEMGPDLPVSTVEILSENLERLAVFPARSDHSRALAVPTLPVYARLRFPSGRLSSLKRIADSPWQISAAFLGLETRRSSGHAVAERASPILASESRDPTLMREGSPAKPEAFLRSDLPVTLAQGKVVVALDVEGRLERSAGENVLTLRRHKTAWVAEGPGQLSLGCGRSVFLVRLPGNLASLRVRARRARDQVTGLEIQVKTHSEWADSLTGYLFNADYSSALSLLEEETTQAEGLLSDKFRDPYAAAVGAYFLLRSPLRGYRSQWLHRLAEEFPHLPDGAVILAWHLIRHERRIKEGMHYLRLAAERGLPVFSEGRRLLQEGLYRTGQDGGRFLAAWRVPGRQFLWTSPLTAWRGDAPDAEGPSLNFDLRLGPGVD